MIISAQCRRLTLGGLCWALVWATLPGTAAELPALKPAVCDPPPVINGALSDACWSKAPPISGFWQIGDDTSRQSNWTRFRALRDDSWLYLGFECTNPEMNRVKQTRFDHDGPVHEDDSVEVFLDPGTGGELYYHYILTFMNVTGERRCTKRGRDQSWDTPWRSATRRNAKGWTAEAAFPLFVLTGHGDLSHARINVTRNRVTFGLDGIGEATVRQREFTSWSRLTRTFHEPDKFGRLRGLDQTPIRAPFLPALVKALVNGYSARDEGQCYSVSGRIRNYTTTGGAVIVAVVDAPVAGEKQEVTKVVTVGSMGHQDFELAVPVNSMLQRAVTVQLRHPDTKELLQSLAVADTSSLAPMDAPLLDRNYYTVESHAVVRCRFGLLPADLAAMTLAVTDGNSRTLVALSSVKPHTDIRVPIDELAAGEHPLTVALREAGGRQMTASIVTLLKKKPNPDGGEVKIDRHNRVVVKDGVPFMPFGVYMNCNSRTAAGWEQHLRWVAEAGFNTVGRWTRVDPGKATRLMDMALELDLAVVDSAIHYVERGKPIKEQIDRVVAGIRAVREYPNLICYYSVDEPNLVAQHVGSFAKVMADCELIYEAVNEHDGYHPVFMLYARDIPPEPVATRWSDILGFDIYLTGGMASFYATPNFMAHGIAVLDKRAASVNQVTWAVPLAERLDPRRTPRALLPPEHRSQVYLALIHGARGFMYFVYSALNHKQSWDVLSELAQQSRVLAPAVLAPEVPQQITYSPGICDPVNRRYTDVQAKLFRYPDGRYVLLAANSRDYPVEMSCTVAGLRGKVRRLFADQICALQDATFSDRLEWCGVRAYLLDLTVPGGPIQIKMTMKPHPEEARKEDRVEVSKIRLGKRNVMVNASFEKQSLPGWPDFTTPYRLEGHPAIGEPGVLLQTDTDRPYHGKHCLRVARKSKGDGAICWGFFAITYPPHLDSPTPYTLSMYLRAAKEGQRAWVRVANIGEKSFTLTTEWKRYSISGTVKPVRFRDKSILLCPSPDDATIWCDAFQMEVGTEPTPFTED